MNVIEVKSCLEDKYVSSRRTLKELSYDKINHEYVCNSTIEAYGFDKIVEQIYNGKNSPESPDALYVNEKVNFIEFKNGCLHPKVEKQKLLIKAVEGLINYCKYIEKNHNLECTDEHLRLIVVYNISKNPMKESVNELENNIFGRAGLRKIRFGLERLQGTYFSEVFTYSQDEFMTYLER